MAPRPDLRPKDAARAPHHLRVQRRRGIALALHWLVHERGQQVVALSLDLGQEVSRAASARWPWNWAPRRRWCWTGGPSSSTASPCRSSRREPSTRADASSGRRWPATSSPASWCASPTRKAAPRWPTAPPAKATIRCEWKGPSRARPGPGSAGPVRSWNLRSPKDKQNYVRRRHIPIDEPAGRSVTIDRNLWGASISLHDHNDPWEAAGRRLGADRAPGRPPPTSRRR